MDVFEEVKKIGLPKDDFIVIGSGILGALGIRPINDVDLLVKKNLFDQLKGNGWKYEIIEIDGRPREKISFGPVEAFKDFWWKGELLEPEPIIAKAQEINGIRFLQLLTLMEAKKGMGREKDLKDVVLIENYLNQP